MLSDRGVSFLAARGISADTAVKLGLFTAHGPDGQLAEPTLDDAADFLGIPYQRGLKTVYVQFRDMRPDVAHKDRYRSPKGSRPAIYNTDVIDDPGLDGKPLTICEGALDAIALIESRAQRVVALPGTELVNLVVESIADFEGIETIILAGDNDAAGHKMNEALCELLSAYRCKMVKQPDGRKDMGEVLEKDGPGGVIRCLRDAKHKAMGVYRASEAPKRSGLEVQKLTSYGPDFERHIGICKRQLSIWTGEPNHGKSGFLKAVIFGLAREKGWTCASAFYEEEICAHTIPDIQRLYLGREPQSTPEADAAGDWVEKHCVFFEAPEEGPTTIEYAMAQIEFAVRRDKIDFVVLDPWSQFEVADPKMSETEMTRRYLIALRNMARDLNIHVAIVAHPRKSGEYGGTTKIADGNDVAGSLHFKGRCDLGVTIQRDPVADGVTNVNVWKVRRREMGRNGVFSLFFHESSGRYSPMTADELARARGEDQDSVVEFGKAARKRRAPVGRQATRRDLYD